jgi:hypothetical protein
VQRSQSDDDEEEEEDEEEIYNQHNTYIRNLYRQ